MVAPHHKPETSAGATWRRVMRGDVGRQLGPIPLGLRGLFDQRVSDLSEMSPCPSYRSVTMSEPMGQDAVIELRVLPYAASGPRVMLDAIFGLHGRPVYSRPFYRLYCADDYGDVAGIWRDLRWAYAGRLSENRSGTTSDARQIVGCLGLRFDKALQLYHALEVARARGSPSRALTVGSSGYVVVAMPGAAVPDFDALGLETTTLEDRVVTIARAAEAP